MKYYHRMLVNDYTRDRVPFHTDARLQRMLRRAAALWYPITEHTGLEFARFILGTAAARGSRDAAPGSSSGRLGL